MIKFGHCALCDLDLRDAEKGEFVEGAVEHFIEISKYQILVMKLCGGCRLLLVSGDKVYEQAEKILNRHVLHWRLNPKEAPEGFENWTVTDPNCSHKKHIANLKKYRDNEMVKQSLKK